ncbi:proliferation marker protein Ki-67 [Erythrolamprus reginae]|uniref:proliferation marker protein Ki-67 n=1 Tax=Erythrolamprus reginae TaxID=121349 RepID=UPI00396C8369
MPFWGEIVVIKRNGTDGNHFPLTANSCLFGRKMECDIRIQLPQVSKEHCKIETNENKEAVLFNLSSANPTQLNGNLFQDPIHLKHGDILTIIDRSFRFEYPSSSFAQKRLSSSQEKETLQILHVQHTQEMDLLHPQNSNYKNSPITDKTFEICSPRRSEKRLQKQYSTPEFKNKVHSTEQVNKLSPLSKLDELMKHEDGTDNVKENTGNETVLENGFHSRSTRSAMSQAKLIKVEQSESSKIQGKHAIAANPIPTFEEKNSEKPLSTQNCDMQQKQECESTNQSDFKNIEDNEVDKYAHFKANKQSTKHFPESHILSLDYAEKAKCLNQFNVTDAFISIENTLPKTKPSWESTQNYSSPCSRKSLRSSKSRSTGVEINSLNRMKNSVEMKECPVQISGQEHESDILIESIYSKTNENRELITETMLNLKDSGDGNSSTVFSSLHLNTSENCSNNIELTTISNDYSCTEAINKEATIPADLSQTSEIMANEIPERTLETKYSTNENKEIGTENDEQNVKMKNDIPTFFSFESRVETFAKINDVSEMNVLCPLNNNSEAKQSPQKHRGTELDILSLIKRKRVSFAGQLSPELFDKHLPPNSPLKKGAIPARLSMPSGNLPRAVLKKAAELKQSVTQGSFEMKQYEDIVSKQVDPHSVPQRQQCISDPQQCISDPQQCISDPQHCISDPQQCISDPQQCISDPQQCISDPQQCISDPQSSEVEETITQEIHMNSLFNEVKTTVCNVTSSSRRSKSYTPRRSSRCGKSGAMGSIQSKRRSGASEANLMVVNSWAEVVKQGVPKVQLKYASKPGFKTRFKKKVASKSSKNNNLLKTPKGKISGYFSTGHANSPAPIVIGKAHTGRLNIITQVPKVVTNYPLKKYCYINESFTGLSEMFCTPPNGKQKSLVPKTQISEINAPEEFEKKSALDVNISSQNRVYNQDVISPALEEVSQMPVHNNLMASLNERNIMGMEEEENLQHESEPVRQILEIKTPKEKSEPDEILLSGFKMLLRTPKEKTESVEALSGVKRLLRTPKQKSEPVEALSAVKRLLKTPKQKSEPIKALSGVKRHLRTPKKKSESVEGLSGVKRLLRTPKQKSDPVEALSGVKGLFKSPKEKSEPVEDLSGIKRLFKSPKEKSEPVEDLSGLKRLLETPEQKSEPVVEVFSGIKTLKTPKQTMERLDDIYTKSRLSTEEILKDMIGSVTKNKTQIMEDGNINGITEEVKETVKPIEDRRNIQIMSPKEKFEPINNMVILEMLDTENDKAKMPGSVNFMEKNGSYTSSRNKLESMKNVPKSCEANLEIKMEESHFPVTQNNCDPDSVGQLECNSFNELKTEFNQKTTRTTSLSENYKPHGMSFKNEAKTDFLKEAAKNSDALKTEEPEPLALAKTRRRKINDCSSAVYTKTIQRPIRNRSTSANCEQTSESFDSHPELNPLHKSESNFKTVETTKLSQRGRTKKHVETNVLGYESNSHGEEESQTENILNKIPNVPLGSMQISVDPSPPIIEKLPKKNMSSRGRGKKSVSSPSVESECNQASDGKDHVIVSLKENQPRRGRPRKIDQVLLKSIPLENNTSEESTVNKCPSSQGKCSLPQVQTSQNENIGSDNISHTQELEKSLKEATVEKQTVNRRKVTTKRKGKSVTSTDSNETIQENESIKTRLRSRNEKKSAIDIKTTFTKGKGNVTMPGEETNKRRKVAAIQSSPETLITTLNADKHGRQKCTISKTSENNVTAMEEILVKKEKKVQFLLKDYFKVSEEESVLGYESNIHKEESQTENILNKILNVPLGSMQISVDPSPPIIEKLSKKNLPSRGRGKKSVSSPSVESESNQASDGKDHVIVSLKENQPRRGQLRNIDQVLLKSIPLENNTSEESTVNKCPSSQGKCSLPQVQNKNFEESEMLPLGNVENRERHILSKRVVKENPPRRGRSKQVNETSSNKKVDDQGPNMVIRQDNNESKRTRGKRNTQESCSLKSQGAVKENPLMQGRCKKTISGNVSTDSDRTHITTIIDKNIDDKNAFLPKEDQSKVGRRTRNTTLFQKIISSVKNDNCHLLSSNRGEHSDEQPNEDLKIANNANEFIDIDIQQNEKKDSKAVSKQKTSRNKGKQLTPCGMSAESNDELKINNKKSPLVTDNVGPLKNNFGKKCQSRKQREETNTASLFSPPKVNITLSPLFSANENQTVNCKDSVGKKELPKLSGTYNIMSRCLRGKYIIPKEELVHETQNKDLQKTALATVINQRRGRQKINKLEAAVFPSLKEKCTLSAGSDNFPNEQISNKKVSLIGEAPKFLKIKTITLNINQNDDQNKNLKDSNIMVQKSSSEHAKKQFNSSGTMTTANIVKNVIPGNKPTVSNTVQTRGKRKMKEENNTLMTELPKETEGRTRASKSIRK